MTNINFRKTRTTNKIKSISRRPRLLVFRSNNQIYASIINQDGSIIASANSLKLAGIKPLEAAKKVGEELAKAAIKNKISLVVFDRRGYKYHGRVAALAQAARTAGLKF